MLLDGAHRFDGGRDQAAGFATRLAEQEEFARESVPTGDFIAAQVAGVFEGAGDAVGRSRGEVEGGKINWIFQPYPCIAVDVNVRQMQACDPIAVYHQGTTTDGLCEAGQTDVLRDNIKKLKALGKPVGLGTHVPETILRSEDEDWGVDFYMACLHNTRKRGAEASSFITGKIKHLKFFMEDREEMLKVIRQVQKPCIAFKVLAGGQMFYGKTAGEIPAVVEAAFRETFAGIKPTDLATVGFFQRDKDQLQENAEIARRVLAEA